MMNPGPIEALKLQRWISTSRVIGKKGSQIKLVLLLLLITPSTIDEISDMIAASWCEIARPPITQVDLPAKCLAVTLKIYWSPIRPHSPGSEPVELIIYDRS